MHDRRPWAELSSTLGSLIISLHLRGVRVTDNTSRLDMTPQGPGSRLKATRPQTEWLEMNLTLSPPLIPPPPPPHTPPPGTTTFPVDCHKIPKSPYQGRKQNIHSSHTCKKGLFSQSAHTVWPVRDTFSFCCCCCCAVLLRNPSKAVHSSIQM